MSSRFALLVLAVFGVDVAEGAVFDPLVWLALCALPGLMNSEIAKSAARKRMIILFPMVSPSRFSISFRRLVACLRGLVHSHEFAILGLAVPAPALVVDPAVQVHPYFAAGLGCR